MKKKKKIPEENYIYSYYQQISNGTITVGRWIRLVYEYLIKGMESGEFFFNQKKANDAITWIENHCFHTEGPKAPGALILELWQKAFLSAIFGIVDKDGNRVHREFLLVVARKNGKSILASAVSSYIWRESGYGARVFCVAPKVDQSDIIYNCIWNMVQLDPEWKELKEKSQEKDTQHRKIYDDSMLARHRQSDLAIPGSNSLVKKVSYTSRDLNGYNPSATICDELAAWGGDKALKAYEVMRSAMGARPDSFILGCTTSGYINESIYDELIKRATRFLLGDSKEKKLLPFLYMVDDIEKWNDINELRKSNPNLGVSVSVDYMLEEIAVADGSLSKKAEFITKYCCLKQTASTALLPAQIVEAACGDELNLEDYRNSYCVCGIDLSQSRDLTACTAVIERNGELYVFAKFFLPSERIDEATQRDGLPYNIYIQRGLLQPSGDNFVDYHDAFEWFKMLVEQYQIYPLVTGFDRYSAQYLIQDMRNYGFVMDDVYQGENLYPVILEAVGLLEDRKIHIGNNDLLKIHMLNAALKMSNERGRGKLIKLNVSQHIDGFAALIDALTVRQKWFAEYGEQLKNRGDEDGAV